MLDQLGKQVNREHKALRVILGLLALQGFLGNEAQLERQAKRETQALMAHKDHKDRKGRKGQQGHKAYRDSKANWVLQVKRVRKVRKVHKAQQGPRVLGSAMEMPRATLSIGTGPCGRT
jgi:hypothetical protein